MLFPLRREISKGGLRRTERTGILKILVVQMNSIVGDFEGNRSRMNRAIRGSKADLVVFPECSLCGYPQQDLLDYPSFAERSRENALQVIGENPQAHFIFGSVEANDSGTGKPFKNVAYFVSEGKILATYVKRLLPTYDVFDEDRFFEPGREACLVDFGGEKIGLTICEDIWNHLEGTSLSNRYHQDPLSDLKDASLLINISASPFEFEKVEAKRDMLQNISTRFSKPFVYCNSVGANDSLIFDGRSYLWSPKGELVNSARAFEEEEMLVDTQASEAKVDLRLRKDPIEDIYDALILGIRDYCQKTGFEKAIVGLSGGIDSALVTCLANDALGAKNVTVAMLPSRFTSQESVEDALVIARKTQNPLHLLHIEEVFGAAEHTLEMSFKGVESDVTEENIQSRIRGMLLMALSNKFNQLLLSTGNKSELAVGYCTLYGDMNGALNPLSDLYKGQVYALAAEANKRDQRIPERIFTKDPSAELRENQRDQDSLPPYELLDQLLKHVIEDFNGRSDLIEKGFESEDIDFVLTQIQRNEYKRYQMPLGLKVSQKAFGLGRRVPLVHRFLTSS